MELATVDKNLMMRYEQTVITAEKGFIQAVMLFLPKPKTDGVDVFLLDF